jgi:OPA family glycerol-3-phosphate transporter-like MFS transporter
MASEQQAWRYRIFVLSWLGYAGFYFCRKNLSVAMPLLARDLGFSNLQLANIVFGYSLLYALGQFVSGVLADRFGPRLVVGIGLLAAVVSNIVMGFSASLVLFAFLGCLNGAGQSTGWPGLVKNMACWFRRRERGVVMAWWSTNYVLGGFLATIFATFAATGAWILPGLGWRRAFWAPALVLGAIAAAYVLWARNEPRDAGVDDILDDEEPLEGPSAAPLADLGSLALLRHILENGAAWVSAGMFFCLKLTRYAFMFWLPVYMTQHLKYAAGEAGYTSSLFELAGFGGVLLAGYASDKLMQSRRFPVGSCMLFGLGAVTYLHPALAASGHLGNAIGLSLIGMMTYGPDTLMSGAAAQDVGSRKGAGTAAGFIDGVGSIGQLFSPYLVAFVTDHYGWDALFRLFVVVAFIGGCLGITRWNHGAAKASVKELGV